MSNQLSLFPEEVKPDPPKESYWKRHFNWEAKVGEVATINDTCAFNIAQNCNRYSYMMKAKVISIQGDIAICETTKDWEKACTHNGSIQPENIAGTLWKVEVRHLSPARNSNKPLQ